MWNEVRKTAVGACLLPRRYSLWISHDKDLRYWFLIHSFHTAKLGFRTNDGKLFGEG